MTGPARPGHARLDGIAWAALGVVVVALSATMDRLADQGVPPFAAPGLLPGLLGALMIVSGAMMAVRRHAAAVPAAPSQGRRLLITVALCLGFSLGLIGHGLPFWLAATLFVTASILVLTGRGAGPRAVAQAAAIGLGAGAVATLVFQYVFLVQLP